MKSRLAAVFLALAWTLPGAAWAQVGGNLAALPAVELALEITTAPDGTPRLSQQEYQLVTGDYYRMSVKSDGKAVWRFEATDLLQNVHLRIVTISGVEVQMQSLVFRAIEFDQAGEAKFSFTPIRPGTYDITVNLAPRERGRPVGEMGNRTGPNQATARVVVR